MTKLFTTFAICLACAAAPLSAQQFVCSGATISPYPQFVSTFHDHQRVAPDTDGLSERFTAFHATFDDADDDDGDGQADLRLNPEYVVYELRGLAASAEVHLQPLGLPDRLVAGMAVEDPYPCQGAAFRARISAAGHAGGILLAGNLRRFAGQRQVILC